MNNKNTFAIKITKPCSMVTKEIPWSRCQWPGLRIRQLFSIIWSYRTDIPTLSQLKKAFNSKENSSRFLADSSDWSTWSQPTTSVRPADRSRDSLKRLSRAFEIMMTNSRMTEAYFSSRWYMGNTLVHRSMKVSPFCLVLTCHPRGADTFFSPSAIASSYSSNVSSHIFCSRLLTR